MRSIKEAALAFDRACAAASVRYALVDGFAVMAWGEPRATMDIDALVELEGAAVRRFVDALGRERLKALPADLEDSLKGEGHTTVLDLDSSYHIDLKAVRTPGERAQVEAAAEVTFGSGRLRVAQAEDTVAYKLLFGRPQDLQDARSILARQGVALDRKLLRELARRLGVSAQLEGLEGQDPKR